MNNRNTIGTENLNGKKILVVDDVKINYIIVKGFLKNSGADVEWAANGFQALASFHKKRPDLILMDYHMPGMDGYQTALAIKKESNRLPIICQTTDWMELQTMGKHLVFNDVMIKPLNKTNLLKKIFENVT